VGEKAPIAFSPKRGSRAVPLESIPGRPFRAKEGLFSWQHLHPIPVLISRDVGWPRSHCDLGLLGRIHCGLIAG